MIATLRPKSEVYYPESDDEPLAETDLHAQEMIALLQALQEFFSGDPSVYVAMDNFIYYEKGNPRACLSPDVYVVLGVAKHLRRIYKVWDEGGHVPAAVFEVTSLSTKKNDIGTKKQRCEIMGVQEYFLFDPYAEYLNPNLQGFTLQNKKYVPIKPDPDGALHSSALRLNFKLEDGLLRVIDPATGNTLLRKSEQEQVIRDAETEIACLKRELARLKK